MLDLHFQHALPTRRRPGRSTQSVRSKARGREVLAVTSLDQAQICHLHTIVPRVLGDAEAFVKLLNRRLQPDRSAGR